MSIDNTNHHKYSNIFNCLHDEYHTNLPFYFHYSVFRSFEYKDVCNYLTTKPLVHDFAVIWDVDHDERIIKVIENLYLAGLLSPIQFIGEHKGFLTIIVAAISIYGMDDFDNYKKEVKLAAYKNFDDDWHINWGKFDRHDRNYDSMHQTDLASIMGIEQNIEHTHILNIDDKWKIGTKELDENQQLVMHKPTLSYHK